MDHVIKHINRQKKQSALGNPNRQILPIAYSSLAPLPLWAQERLLYFQERAAGVCEKIMALFVGSTRSVVAYAEQWSSKEKAARREQAMADAATALDFRLTNAQKVLVDAMEPPPREGGVRFCLARYLAASAPLNFRAP